MLNNLTFSYSEQDPIFFITEAKTQIITQGTCGSCEYKFQKRSEMNYCEFCAVSNCKKCFKKTRFFFNEEAVNQNRQSLALTTKEKKKARGKICALCDRKFIIHKQFCKSFKHIDAMNAALQNVQGQYSNFMNRLDEEREDLEARKELVLKSLDDCEPEIKFVDQQIKETKHDLEMSEQELLRSQTQAEKQQHIVKELMCEISECQKSLNQVSESVMGVDMELFETQ